MQLFTCSRKKEQKTPGASNLESINTGVEFYSNVKASEVEWVWYPYIPCGKITMLQGDPGEGKSTLIIHVAAILTKGGYLPDGQKIKKPEMVIYQKEIR